jgi:N-acetylglucosaminyldiphosphoundecaprenol N-acetyl-beta-D-mannosaminyltransferase
MTSGIQAGIECVQVWGTPFARLTRVQVVDAVMAMVEAGVPSFFITANVHYVKLSDRFAELRQVNSRASFLIADGAPIVWASRYGPKPLPERVAGSDLIYDLCERSARDGYRVFLLGGDEGVAEAAGERLIQLFPDLHLAGTACPPYRNLTPDEHNRLIAQIVEAKPDLLFVAYGQPKGEFWIDRNLDRLGVPVCVQVGASLDFIAGRVQRAPKWMQKAGLEWAYRISMEPRRLTPRYAQDFAFLVRILITSTLRPNA